MEKKIFDGVDENRTSSYIHALPIFVIKTSKTNHDTCYRCENLYEIKGEINEGVYILDHVCDGEETRVLDVGVAWEVYKHFTLESSMSVRRTEDVQ